ncbi:nucleoside deaminase [Paracrocinitomix mangrovi]|uniref:nucleoside deaminase n=1 Tax=Paracrocinitomix mangrovi TaxID=2862509 RepID=UPI001C8DE830|nr:nucleoside deaminase [Paracrocinitomix mangrovi]UKN00578.1 nucleoside deaminase [Paracrocinitomix mangrovi]
MIEIYTDEFFMKQAFKEAEEALAKNEVPVGAVVVMKDQIIGRGHNLTEQFNDVTAHAEIQAISAAAEFLGAKYLKGCTLYVTLEPCVMCAGALYWSQIDKVVFAATDDKRGAGRHDNLYHPKTIVEGGLMAQESADMIKAFFADKRK